MTHDCLVVDQVENLNIFKLKLPTDHRMHAPAVTLAGLKRQSFAHAAKDKTIEKPLRAHLVEILHALVFSRERRDLRECAVEQVEVVHATVVVRKKPIAEFGQFDRRE